jgi:hypothetical protein
MKLSDFYIPGDVISKHRAEYEAIALWLDKDWRSEPDFLRTMRAMKPGSEDEMLETHLLALVESGQVEMRVDYRYVGKIKNKPGRSWWRHMEEKKI